jgi:DNA-binding NarL/FixJ family response regulator
MEVRILVADDNRIVREGLRLLLERKGFQVVAEAANGCEAVEQAAAVVPEVVILDLSMPFLNGIEAAREIKRLVPRTHSIILTIYNDKESILEAFRVGVQGYVLKTRAVAELIQAIGEVMEGKYFLSPDIPQHYMRASGAGDN